MTFLVRVYVRQDNMYIHVYIFRCGETVQMITQLQCQFGTHELPKDLFLLVV